MMISPQPGKTYIMTTSQPSTIIFKFNNVGEYEVNGKVVHCSTHSDLALPYAIADIAEYKPKG